LSEGIYNGSLFIFNTVNFIFDLLNMVSDNSKYVVLDNT
jgi:hypothetical protein